MKNQLIVFILLASFCWIGCSDKSIDPAAEKPEDPITSFRKGLGKLALSDQKEIFNDLPAPIKSGLWIDRMNEGIANESNDPLKDLLGDLKSTINSEMFLDSIDYDLSILYDLGDESFMIEDFDSTNYYKYTQFLNDPIEVKPIVPPPPLPTCDCNRGRSGFLRSNDCGALKPCFNRPCKATRFGCGVLWLQTCDGRC